MTSSHILYRLWRHCTHLIRTISNQRTATRLALIGSLIKEIKLEEIEAAIGTDETVGNQCERVTNIGDQRVPRHDVALRHVLGSALIGWETNGWYISNFR